MLIQLKNKLMKIKKMRLLKKIQLSLNHSEMEDNGLSICQKVFKKEDMVKVIGLKLDQHQRIGITNTQIELFKNLQMLRDHSMNILILRGNLRKILKKKKKLLIWKLMPKKQKN